MNKNIIAILIGIIALLAGTVAAFIILKQKFSIPDDDFDDFEDFDMIGDDDDFFADDEYSDYENFGAGSDIPYADASDDDSVDEL